jgi:hypothetical protein
LLSIREQVSNVAHMGAVDTVQCEAIHVVLTRDFVFGMMIPFRGFNSCDFNPRCLSAATVLSDRQRVYDLWVAINKVRTTVRAVVIR